jgi:HNH endonuclease/NUMOD4 motif
MKRKVDRKKWLPIAGFPNYIISEFGDVLSIEMNTLKKAHLDEGGYLRVNLPIRVKRRVHRLVAAAFVPNPHNLPEVHHKDENKLNNHYSNLEWKKKSDHISGHMKKRHAMRKII